MGRIPEQALEAAQRKHLAQRSLQVQRVRAVWHYSRSQHRAPHLASRRVSRVRLGAVEPDQPYGKATRRYARPLHRKVNAVGRFVAPQGIPPTLSRLKIFAFRTGGGSFSDGGGKIWEGVNGRRGQLEALIWSELAGVHYAGAGAGSAYGRTGAGCGRKRRDRAKQRCRSAEKTDRRRKNFQAAFCRVVCQAPGISLS